jgi:hypothetical protein
VFVANAPAPTVVFAKQLTRSLLGSDFKFNDKESEIYDQAYCCSQLVLQQGLP